jgi:hypothetical protein
VPRESRGFGPGWAGKDSCESTSELNFQIAEVNGSWHSSPSNAGLFFFFNLASHYCMQLLSLP